MPPNDGLVDDLARAILDGVEIDWTSAEASAGAAERPLLGQLRLLAAVADLHRQLPDSSARVRRELVDEGLKEWGPLRVLERIGHGAFGQVYRAWDTRLDREVALKLLPATCPGEEPNGSSIINEGRLLARVRHPNVVTIYGAERIDDRVGLWTEFVKGRTLEQVLQEGGPFTATEAMDVGIELCQAVAAVHAAGLLHRDIKAQNVMVTAERRVVLMDFGIGRERDSSSDDPLAGTPLYLAPEVIRQNEASVRSDVYAIGVLLYHVLTGSYPMRARSLRDLKAAHERGEYANVRTARPGLPPRLCRVIERAIDPDSGRRYDGAGSLAADLVAVKRRGGIVRATSSVAAGVAVLLGAWAALEVAGLSALPRMASVLPFGSRFATAADDGLELARQGTSSSEAYVHYLFGRRHFDARSYDRMLDAEREFGAALQLDPEYARAHAALSMTLTYMAWLEGRTGIAVMAGARDAALKALAIDDSVALAHTARAFVHEYFEHDPVHAQAEHIRAMALGADDPWVLRPYATFLQNRDAVTEALDIRRRDLSLDPTSTYAIRSNAQSLYVARRYDECVAEARRAVTLDPVNVSLSYDWLALCLERQGNHRDAVGAWEDGRAARGNRELAGKMKMLFAADGWEAYWRGRLLLAGASDVALAAAYVRLGEVDEAVESLQRLYAERSPWIFFTNHPEWDPLRSDPRFQALRRRAGLSDDMNAALARMRRMATTTIRP